MSRELKRGCWLKNRHAIFISLFHARGIKKNLVLLSGAFRRVNLLLPHAGAQGAQWLRVHRAQQSCFSACVLSLWFINTTDREEERGKEERLAGAAVREGRFTVLWYRTAMKAFITLVELASLLVICFSFSTFTTDTALPEHTHTNIS